MQQIPGLFLYVTSNVLPEVLEMKDWAPYWLGDMTVQVPRNLITVFYLDLMPRS